MKKAFIFLLVLVLVMPIFSACTKTADHISVYFKDIKTNALNEERRPIKDTVKKTSAEAIAKYAVNELIKGPSDEKNAPVIDDDAKLLKLEIKDSVATVNISSHYEKKKGVDELLQRFALVKTLCSIDGVDAIVILVEGSPLTDSQGKEIGLIRMADVLDADTTQLKEEIKIKLYFPNSKKQNLTTEIRTVEVQNSLSPERTVVNELMKGPKDKSLSAAIPAGTKLLDIETKDNVCFVNFSSEFVSNSYSGSLRTTLVLYSVVNSLCQLENVESVQILINGEAGVEFGNFVLDIPYEANEDF